MHLRLAAVGRMCLKFGSECIIFALTADMGALCAFLRVLHNGFLALSMGQEQPGYERVVVNEGRAFWSQLRYCKGILINCHGVLFFVRDNFIE